MSKYKNKKIRVDNIEFDSKAEYRRYIELSLMLKVGEIKELKIHPKYILLDKNDMFRALSYEADFEYITKRNERIIEDVKGFKTEVFKIKEKLFYSKYGIKITLINAK